MADLLQRTGAYALETDVKLRCDQRQGGLVPQAVPRIARLAIIDTPESLSQDHSTAVIEESRHFVFAPDNALFDCSIAGSSTDVIDYFSGFRFICESVTVHSSGQ